MLRNEFSFFLKFTRIPFMKRNSPTNSFARISKPIPFNEQKKLPASNKDQLKEKEVNIQPLTQKDENQLSQITNDNSKDKRVLDFIHKTLLYEGDDPFPEKLFERPQRGVTWGLGGIFRSGELPNVEEIIKYLELQKCKDITLTDLEALNMRDRSRYQIVCSTYSIRHNYKVAKELWKDVMANGFKPIPNPPRVLGRKDDECFFVEEIRQEYELENRWLYPAKDEDATEVERKSGKKKAAFFEPFDERKY